MIKYLVVPGKVISKDDYDIHYINAEQLIKLYGVDRSECIIFHKHEFVNNKNLIILEPDSTGNYKIRTVK